MKTMSFIRDYFPSLYMPYTPVVSKVFRLLALFIFQLFLLPLPWADTSAQDLQENLKRIKLPEGFRIELYATNIKQARSMAPGPGKTLFVGSRDSGKVYALTNHDERGKPTKIINIQNNLNGPNGVAFRNNDLYVAEIDRILKFANIEKTSRKICHTLL